MSDTREKKDGRGVLDPPPDRAEEEAAARLAEGLERLEQGAWPDEAGDDLAVAGMIRAAAVEQPLGRQRLDALLDEVLPEGAPGARPDEVTAGGDRPAAQAPARRRLTLKVMALAASVTVVVLATAVISRTTMDRAPRSSVARSGIELGGSRPTDVLLGGPIRDRAGASSRLDLVFADRLRDFRRATLHAAEVR